MAEKPEPAPIEQRFEEWLERQLRTLGAPIEQPPEQPFEEWLERKLRTLQEAGIHEFNPYDESLPGGAIVIDAIRNYNNDEDFRGNMMLKGICDSIREFIDERLVRGSGLILLPPPPK
jgi:hypothetical protein